MIFEPTTLADTLSETAGYKSGLALSVVEMCDHLAGTRYPDVLRASEEFIIRLRSEEYDQLFYKLLHRIGYTAEEFDGDITGAKLFHKYKDSALAEWTGVTEIFVRIWPQLMDEAAAKGSSEIDPTPFMREAFEKHGRVGLDMAMERLQLLHHAMHVSPIGRLRYVEWQSEVKLASLFAGDAVSPEVGRFIDQRFIDYLSVNHARLAEIHWRRFEELTAEFFNREGYQVQLGPGSNDDGVDVRVWRPGQAGKLSPQLLIQCKRQKAKVEKVVVKGLYADVTHEGAEYGLIVTTSELSPGGRSTIATRGYPIQEVDRAGLVSWLRRLRTPGTGIVRV
jgi:restriction system protein